MRRRTSAFPGVDPEAAAARAKYLVPMDASTPTDGPVWPNPAQEPAGSPSGAPGASDDVCARLVRLAAGHRVTVLVDTVGEHLLRAAAAGADIVKANSSELLDTTGLADVTAAAAALGRRGAKAVVVSLGEAGMIACTPGGSWRAAPPARIVGNPTGAGDAAAAALIAGAVAGAPWPDRLREAVALAAAAVLQPTAGSFDMEDYVRFVPQVLVEEQHATGFDR